MTLAICLLLLAFLLTMAELSFPSFGILSLFAAAAFAFSLVYAFAESSTLGWGVAAAGMLLLPVAVGLGLKVLPHTPIGTHLFLSPPSEDKVQHGTRDDDRYQLQGQEGEALSELRPSGAALFAGRRYDVISSGRYIPRGTKIRVLAVDGLRILVEDSKEENGSPSP